MSAQSTAKAISAYPKGYARQPKVYAMPELVEAPKKEAVGTYLRALKETIWTALLTTLFSAALGIFAICNLVLFLQNNASLLHPYLAIFLAFGSAALFAVAVISALTAKKRIELVIGRVLRSSYEPYSVS